MHTTSGPHSCLQTKLSEDIWTLQLHRILWPSLTRVHLQMQMQMQQLRDLLLFPDWLVVLLIHLYGEMNTYCIGVAGHSCQLELPWFLLLLSSQCPLRTIGSTHHMENSSLYPSEKLESNWYAAMDNLEMIKRNSKLVIMH
ncbi:hypothetical protein SAY86_026917 [Trapa natans]|uniref:Uncharacterized protein n=1 Tax=Trapa natans TaxID=22666 RepID=A0AAN7QI99_TRANT|nr:hypothetical protein SAY86_026917 [Trapa natans]